MDREDFRPNAAEAQIHFAEDEDVEDIIDKVLQAKSITNADGHEYSRESIVKNIYMIVGNINSGKYDSDEGDYLLKADLLTITRSGGIRQAVEDSVAHIIVRRQRR